MARQKGKAQVEKKNKSLEKLTIEYVPIDAIKPNKYNPNRQSEHDFELLTRSMKEDGFTQPVIVQKATKEIVDGEHRWRCATQLGLKEIPIVYVDMPEEQMRIATLRHNRARGNEDVELSAQVLRDLRELGALDWAQDSLMLDDVELQMLIDDVPAPDALADDDFVESWDIGSKEANSDSKLGDGTTSSTPEATERLRDMERQIEEAKTEEDKAKAVKEANVFRLVVIFSDDEADLVRSVLGEAPAVALLELCRATQK